jgi:hypothetical protein
MNRIEFFCPACGYGLKQAPWTEDSPSDEICPCCGIYFGFDDFAGGNPSLRIETYKSWRMKWVTNGQRWFSSSSPKPLSWNPKTQLRRAERND